MDSKTHNTHNTHLVYKPTNNLKGINDIARLFLDLDPDAMQLWNELITGKYIGIMCSIERSILSGNKNALKVNLEKIISVFEKNNPEIKIDISTKEAVLRNFIKFLEEKFKKEGLTIPDQAYIDEINQLKHEFHFEPKYSLFNKKDIKEPLQNRIK